MALDLKWSTLYYQLQFEGRINSALPNTVWDLDALLKCQFFASLNRCLTADNLFQRAIQCNPVCPLRNVEAELALHLFA
jgi:hypothetical protein